MIHQRIKSYTKWFNKKVKACTIWFNNNNKKTGKSINVKRKSEQGLLWVEVMGQTVAMRGFLDTSDLFLRLSASHRRGSFCANVLEYIIIGCGGLCLFYTQTNVLETSELAPNDVDPMADYHSPIALKQGTREHPKSVHDIISSTKIPHHSSFPSALRLVGCFPGEIQHSGIMALGFHSQ